MIESGKILKYLNENELTIEEFFLLYVVHVKQTNGEDHSFLREAGKYYQKHSYYDPDGANIKLSWHDLATSLGKRGFLITYPGYIKKDAVTGLFTLVISKLETTDKFRNTLFSDDREYWWNQFVDAYLFNTLYGHENIPDKKSPRDWITDTKTGKRYNPLAPEPGETTDTIKSKFWKLCGNGDLGKCWNIVENTRKYLDKEGIPCKLSKFIDNYETFMRGFEANQSDDQDSRYNSVY